MSSTAENTPPSAAEPANSDIMSPSAEPVEGAEVAPEVSNETPYSAEDARFVRWAVEAAVARHAESVMVLHLAQVSDFTDYFMICNGTNDRQVQAITDSIIRSLRDKGLRPLHVEGQRQGQWVLIDYGGEMVIHVFLDETRQFYALERLWGDAPEITEAIMDSLDGESASS